MVPVRSLHAGPNPKYFNRGRGVTWYNLLSDQGSGLNAITVPGTLRDSLVLLAVVLEQKTELQPFQIMTDTGAYQRVNLDRITPHWDGVLRLVGSLKLGLVPAMGVMRTLQVDDRPPRWRRRSPRSAASTRPSTR